MDTCSCEERASIRPEMPCVTPPSCWFVRPGGHVRVEQRSAPRSSWAPRRRSRRSPCASARRRRPAARARSRASAGSARLRYAASATAAATITTSDARAAARRGCPRAKASIGRDLPRGAFEKLWRTHRESHGSAKRSPAGSRPTPRSFAASAREAGLDPRARASVFRRSATVVEAAAGFVAFSIRFPFGPGGPSREMRSRAGCVKRARGCRPGPRA